MPRRTQPSDLYAQVFDMRVVVNTENSTALNEAPHSTGLSVRGNHAWLIHSINLWTHSPVFLPAAHAVYATVCTVKGMAQIPTPGDPGVVHYFAAGLQYVTEGMTYWKEPMEDRFLPPIPLAAPNISLYVKTSLDTVSLRGIPIIARLHFTTVPMTPEIWTEIAETWAYS